MKTIYLLVKNGEKTYFNRAGVAFAPNRDGIINLKQSGRLRLQGGADILVSACHDQDVGCLRLSQYAKGAHQEAAHMPSAMPVTRVALALSGFAYPGTALPTHRRCTIG
jgi:hypothetical protein